MRTFFLIALITVTQLTMAQRPREVQIDNEPPDWSNPWTIGFIVVVPVLLIIGGIYIRNRRRKK